MSTISGTTSDARSLTPTTCTDAASKETGIFELLNFLLNLILTIVYLLLLFALLYPFDPFYSS